MSKKKVEKTLNEDIENIENIDDVTFRKNYREIVTKYGIELIQVNDNQDEEVLSNG